MGGWALQYLKSMEGYKHTSKKNTCVLILFSPIIPMDSPIFVNHSPSFSFLPHAETPSLQVYFFCKKMDHQPTEFTRRKPYQCNLCGVDEKDQWMYYCSECDRQRRAKYYFAAKHINEHANWKHSK